MNWTLNHPETKAVEQGSALTGREHHRTLPLHKLAFVVDKLQGVKAILADEKANVRSRALAACLVADFDV